MLHIVHINLGTAVDQISQGFATLIGGLSRYQRSLAEGPGELTLHAVYVHIHIVGIAVPGLNIPLHHAYGVHHILFWRLYGLRPVLGRPAGSAGLALKVRIHVKYHKQRLAHEIHIRKLHGIPVALSRLGIGKLLDHRISYHKTRIAGLRQFSLSQRDLL